MNLLCPVFGPHEKCEAEEKKWDRRFQLLDALWIFVRMQSLARICSFMMSVETIGLFGNTQKFATTRFSAVLQMKADTPDRSNSGKGK